MDSNRNNEKIATFASRLSDALVARGMSAAALSRATGLSDGTISRYLSGMIEPRVMTVRSIAHALNVSDSWMMGFDVEMDREDPFDRGDDLKRALKLQEAQRAAGFEHAEELRALQGGGLSTTEAGLLQAFRKMSLADQMKVISLCLELTGGSKE